MKVTQAAPAFQPINILIESEAEIKLLANLVACCTGAVSEVACGNDDTAYEVYNKLRAYVTPSITTKIDITTTN